MDIFGLSITRLNHDCFKIQGSKLIYFDPFQIQKGEAADYLFITHEHQDHLSPQDIEKVSDTHTIIITIPSCLKRVLSLKVADIKVMEPTNRLELPGTTVETIAAYNINKYRSEGLVFHPKDDGRVGFIITLDGVRIYHAGDTDAIEEMKTLRDIDIALLPVSGTYVMTAEEAAMAAGWIKAKITIPMHYGAIVGTDDDARRFAEKAAVKTLIL
ncbi:MAG: MBL fold metallo-hydrolase [Nanoarchaeota archaeon]